MDGMAEQRLAAEQAIMLIDAEIIRRIRIERLGECYLVMVFRQMRLNKTFGMFAGKRPAQFELFRCRGDRKTRRNYIIKAILAMPARDQLLALVIT